jgi:hypothetical protein
MPEVRRMIRWFEKLPGDKLVGEAELQGVTLAELQELFGARPPDLMQDCWPVRKHHVRGLMPFLSVPIKLDDYEYFVEADAID